MKFSEMIEGLEIFARYEDSGMDGHLAGAAHDVIYGPFADFDAYADGDPQVYVEEHGEYPEYNDSRMSLADNTKLRQLGWLIDPEQGHWMHFAWTLSLPVQAPQPS
jgi:hypothetical protein